MLYFDHNLIDFYTWGDARCCLPKGAIQATLRNNLPNLRKGDVLIFEQEHELSPLTDRLENADVTRRCAIRLQTVVSDWFELTQQSLDDLEIIGVPTRLLMKLKELEKNKRFYGEEEFRQAIATTLGTEWPDVSLWEDGHGLYGQYYEFDEPGFDPEKRKLGRLDPEINFEWTRKPDPRIRPDRFAVRWTGNVEAKASGIHTFYTT